MSVRKDGACPYSYLDLGLVNRLFCCKATLPGASVLGFSFYECGR